MHGLAASRPCAAAAVYSATDAQCHRRTTQRAIANANATGALSQAPPRPGRGAEGSTGQCMRACGVWQEAGCGRPKRRGGRRLMVGAAECLQPSCRSKEFQSRDVEPDEVRADKAAHKADQDECWQLEPPPAVVERNLVPASRRANVCVCAQPVSIRTACGDACRVCQRVQNQLLEGGCAQDLDRDRRNDRAEERAPKHPRSEVRRDLNPFAQTVRPVSPLPPLSLSHAVTSSPARPSSVATRLFMPTTPY
jgi:hypothetical protein